MSETVRRITGWVRATSRSLWDFRHVFLLVAIVLGLCFTVQAALDAGIVARD